MQRSSNQEFRTAGAPPAYRMKETVGKAALLKIVKRKHKGHLLEILLRFADRMSGSVALT